MLKYWAKEGVSNIQNDAVFEIVRRAKSEGHLVYKMQDIGGTQELIRKKFEEL